MASRCTDDDITTCPVLRPTLREFKVGISAYVTSIDKQLREAGVVKIIPPAGWAKLNVWRPNKRDPNPAMPADVFPMVKAISQAPSGSRGLFEMAMSDKKPMTAEQFRDEARKREATIDTSDAAVMERKFWQLMQPWGQPSLYGADVLGSLFGDEPASGWNLDHIDSLLHELVGDMPGITKAMLYFGSWRSVFAFHKEDMDLYSVNYLHYGAPKSWYGVPPSAAKRLESLAVACFGEAARGCKQFLRHKTSVISPKHLEASKIPFHRVVQYPGEFVITYPTAYHQGFNHGFNIAEAVNFATEQWIEFGHRAVLCKCRPDYVYINMENLERRRARLKAGLPLLDVDGVPCGPGGAPLLPVSGGARSMASVAGAHTAAGVAVAPAAGVKHAVPRRRKKGHKDALPTTGFVLDDSAPRSPVDTSKGSNVVLQWEDRWFPAFVLDVDGKQRKLRYKGYGAKFDEWLPYNSTRIRNLPKAVTAVTLPSQASPVAGAGAGAAVDPDAGAPVPAGAGAGSGASASPSTPPDAAAGATSTAPGRPTADTTHAKPSSDTPGAPGRRRRPATKAASAKRVRRRRPSRYARFEDSEEEDAGKPEVTSAIGGAPRARNLRQKPKASVKAAVLIRKGGTPGRPHLATDPSPSGRSKATPTPGASPRRHVVVRWDDGDVYKARILRRSGNRLFVHYVEWDHGYDEWVDSRSPLVAPWDPAKALKDTVPPLAPGLLPAAVPVWSAVAAPAQLPPAAAASPSPAPGASPTMHAATAPAVPSSGGPVPATPAPAPAEALPAAVVPAAPVSAAPPAVAAPPAPPSAPPPPPSAPAREVAPSTAPAAVGADVAAAAVVPPTSAPPQPPATTAAAAAAATPAPAHLLFGDMSLLTERLPDDLFDGL